MTAKILPFTGTGEKPPTIENVTVPRRPSNAELRTREYLSTAEIESLMVT